jgi:NAD(P)-dependent dehydrogenase (short-subunit alcohol dehydrogenase family)
MNKLTDKVVVITGASGTIGSYYCEALIEAGAIVIATDINIKSLNKLKVKNPNRLFPEVMDITNKKNIDEVIKKTSIEHGKIDAIVNNAYPRNKNYGNNLEKLEFSDFCENVDMHLGGYFLVSQRFALFFKNNSKGNIINMSSIYGVIAPRFEVYEGTNMTMPVEYAAIKSGVIHLTKYFAQYYKKSSIRANCISPGGILADQPNSFINSYNKYCGNKGMLEEKDLAGLLIFLLSDESLSITGQNFVIDDGFAL